MTDISQSILDTLKQHLSLTTDAIAAQLGLDPIIIYDLLHGELSPLVVQDHELNWSLCGQKEADETTATPAQSFSYASLELIRNRLLDLSARNRLLNFRHTKRDAVRVIDDDLNRLNKVLINGQSIAFEAVPEPTEEALFEQGYRQVHSETGEIQQLRADPKALDWAKHLGLNTEYSLPRNNRNLSIAERSDHPIQTLLYPREMEAVLRNISGKAKTAIEESGANILYLCLGFLEWYERKDSDVKRLAPLYLIPVKVEKGKLNKKTNTYRYELTYTEEDIVSNLSLQEKLRRDFGLALPILNEEQTPEDYLSLIDERVIQSQSEWSVKRYVSLGLFNFGKLLMYLDLDPSRWPVGRGNISNHPVLNDFFGSGKKEAHGAAFQAEYDIDNLPNIHDDFPLIDNADSSQHSALIDVIQGKNTVIEGPPGTGKSQTITNIIAAAMSQGKTILFVAEKMAALNVVKQRLDKAGLGHFCLELHSHNTNKKAFVQSIKDSFDFRARARPPKMIEHDIEKYEQHKKDLQTYANVINQNWKQTGLSIHDILMSVTRHRREVGQFEVDISIENITGDQLTADRLHHLNDMVHQFKQAYDVVSKQVGLSSDLSKHPWFGVENLELKEFDLDKVSSALQAWNEEMDSFQAKTQDFCESLALPRDSLSSLARFEQFFNDIRALPTLEGDEFYQPLHRLDEDSLEKIKAYADLYEKIVIFYSEKEDTFHASALDTLNIDELKRSYQKALDIGANHETSIVDLTCQIEKIDGCINAANDIAEQMEYLASNLPTELSLLSSPTVRGMVALLKVLSLFKSVPLAAFSYRDTLFDNDELDRLLPQLKEDLDRLSASRKQLGQTFDINHLPDHDDLYAIQKIVSEGGIFSWFSSRWRSARKQLISLRRSSTLTVKELIDKLPSLVDFTHDYSAIQSSNQYARLLGDNWKGLETDIDQCIRLRSWYQAVRKEYGYGFGPSVPMGNAIIGLDVNIIKGLNSLNEQGLDKKIGQLVQSMGLLSSMLPANKPLASQDFEPRNLNNGLVYLKVAMTHICHGVAQWFKTDQITVLKVKRTLDQLEDLNTRVETWENSSINTDFFEGAINLSLGPSQYDSYEFKRLQRSLRLYEYIVHAVQTAELTAYYKNQTCIDEFQLLQQKMTNIHTSYQDLLRKREAFLTLTDLDLESWCIHCEQNFYHHIERNRQALSQPQGLISWVDYIKLRARLGREGLKKLFKAVENKHLAIGLLEQGFQYAVYDLLSRDIYRSHPSLDQYSGVFLSSVRERFRDYDINLQQLQREKIAWSIAQYQVPEGTTGAKVADRSERALLKRECEKKTRHRPIRELLQRAGQATVALKPCFMMGPMSVAQYIKPGQIDFDLLVMDEASQVKPEDALGAIARSKQVVVVGDPKQLPPTSFFDRQIEADNDEETTEIETSESILDAAMPMFNLRRLRWHYRSQHESLIAFSNRYFYGGNLVVFPSPYAENDEYGVKFTHVENGVFTDQKNLAESQCIAESIHRHLLEHPKESLGVVAMNTKQREQIERALEERSKVDEQLQVALEVDEQSEEPLFIKNLENVQGDERDVIFISCTYGPSKVGGKVFQRFGPINGENGWRRLNVLFTRAKKRIQVFSSLLPEQILTSEKSARGVLLFKGFLEFSKSGGVLLDSPVHTGKEPDSDFEIDVANRLREHGFECEYQVGVAGYFIDIAVKDPGNPGRYLAGVECDGATYHSAKSVRDRDRLRQTILEGLGWNIKRIWSTDWFKNPDAQIKPLVEKLNQLRATPPQ